MWVTRDQGGPSGSVFCFFMPGGQPGLASLTVLGTLLPSTGQGLSPCRAKDITEGGSVAGTHVQPGALRHQGHGLGLLAFPQASLCIPVACLQGRGGEHLRQNWPSPSVSYWGSGADGGHAAGTQLTARAAAWRRPRARVTRPQRGHLPNSRALPPW